MPVLLRKPCSGFGCEAPIKSSSCTQSVSGLWICSAMKFINLNQDQVGKQMKIRLVMLSNRDLNP